MKATSKNSSPIEEAEQRGRIIATPEDAHDLIVMSGESPSQWYCYMDHYLFGIEKNSITVIFDN